MASKSELITRIILKGQTDPSLQKAFSTANKMADNSIDKLAKYGEAAKKAAKVGAVAVGTGLVASAKAAIDYESAFAGVMKTVDETGTTTYADLSKGILEMSKRMPASANEIAGVAEAAGQLGIKADDVLKFSETMVNLGETTNLTSEDAASSIAKMFNIMGTDMKNVDRFGSTIVALGNNAATTEADIVEMASRIAAGGVQIGLSEAEILALSTTLSSVGLAAEGGGTAISTVMANIDKAVATNGETLGTWAETAGMSSKEFKAAWQKDAYGALQKVINGMGDAQSGGKNLNILLEELGVSGIRSTDTMKRLSNASELMGEMTTLANTAWGENSALTNEANVRYNTMASKIAMARNKLVSFGIAVGEKVMPYIEKMLDAFNKIDFEALADKIGKAIGWISKHSTTIIAVIGAIAGAIAGFKVATFVMAIVKVVQSIMFLSKTIGVMKLIGLAITAMGGPVTLIVAAIGLLVGAFVALWMKSEKFRNFWKGLWSGIKSFTATAVNAIKNFFTTTLPNAITTAINWFKALPAKVSEFLSQLPYKVGFLLGRALAKIVKWGIDMVNAAKVKVPQFINACINFFKQLPGKIWTFLKNAVAKVTQWGSQLKTKGIAAAKMLSSAVVNGVKSLPGKLKTAGVNLVKGLWNGIKSVKNWILDKIKGFGKGILDGVKSVFKIGSPSKAMDKLGRFLPQGFGNGIVAKTKYAVSSIKAMGGKVMSAAGKINPTISAQVGMAGQAIKRFATGGTVTSPQMAIVGDANETIVPHGNTPHNRALLREAAAGVGAPAGGGNVFQITFAPVIHGGNAEDNRRMLQEEEAEFERRMDAYFAKKGRLAF